MATEKYTGSFPNLNVSGTETNAQVHNNMCIWAKNTAADNNFNYVVWTNGIKATQTCPVCQGRRPGNYYGWNCIGFTIACWKHGGHLNCKCYCGVIDDGTGDRMLATRNADSILAIAKSHIGLSNLKVIYNNGKAIPQSSLQPGDICLMYNGNTYQHMYLYVGGGKLADSSRGRSDTIKYGVSYSGGYASGTKIAIRYTGTGRTFAAGSALRNDDVRSAEVKKWQSYVNWVLGSAVLAVDGSFGPATEAKTKTVQTKLGVTADGYVGPKTLEKAKAYTKSVTPKPTPVKKTVEEIAKEVIAGKWGSGDTRKQKLKAAGYDYDAVQKKVNEMLNPKKSIDVIAKEVIAGKWGSGDERKKKLKAAGYDYDKVQAKVNELLKPKKKSVDVIAQEVIDGKWGSGDTRKKKLVAAGYNYEAVQAKVNEILKKKSTIVVKKAYSGTLPTTTIKKTNQQVIDDACRWAVWIANDNRFHYGYTNKTKGANAHHNGCYFCGTNKSQKKNMLDPQFTYCCNPFVGAAWAHGGCVPKALELCRKTSSWDFGKGAGYDKSTLFTNLGHPAKSSLKKGDVLCKDTHVALYIGGGKIAEAGSGDDNKRNSAKWNNSIRVTTLTDGRYAAFKRVHRFNSSVNATVTMSFGEISDRVFLWQKYLNWYFGKKVVSEDAIYGDGTLKYTKQFQEKEVGKGQGDGYVGPKTLAAAAKVKK